jgi:hypothetical protein
MVTTGTSIRVSSGRLVDWKANWRDLGRLGRHPILAMRRIGSLVNAAVRGEIVCVPAELCINGFAYSFGRNGWQYYRDLAEELLDNPAVALEETRFHRFFREVRATSLTEMLSFHDPKLTASLPRLPYGAYPWGPQEWYRVRVNPHRLYDRSRMPRRTSSCPSTKPGFTEFLFYEKSPEVDRVIGREFDKLSSLIRSFAESGYRPFLGRNPLPSAVRLVSKSGETRFLVKDGNHRLAVLAAFGCERVWLRLDRRRFRPVFEAEASMWPWVRSGLLDMDDARRLFHLYFELDGSERARALGVRSSATESRFVDFSTGNRAAAAGGREGRSAWSVR